MTLPVAEYLTNKVFLCQRSERRHSAGRSEGIRYLDQGSTQLSSRTPPPLVTNESSPPARRKGSRLYCPFYRPVIPHRDKRRSMHIATHQAPIHTLVRRPLVLRTRDGSELPTVFDQDSEEQDDEGVYSRSTSINKRRKRGARKGKGSSVPTPQPLSPSSPLDDTLETLATASKSLAREISKVSRSSSKRHGDFPVEPPDLLPVPVTHIPPVVTKKASKWKLGFGKNSSSGEKPLASPVDDGLISINADCNL
jgi:hypothetical protein